MFCSIVLSSFLFDIRVRQTMPCRVVYGVSFAVFSNSREYYQYQSTCSMSKATYGWRCVLPVCKLLVELRNHLSCVNHSYSVRKPTLSTTATTITNALNFRVRGSVVCKCMHTHLQSSKCGKVCIITVRNRLKKEQLASCHKHLPYDT